MVQLAVASSQARDRLLDAAVEHALDKGLVDLSLREIAAAIGTSHRMLIYHFGSREGLIVAVVREVERRERESLGMAPLSVADARRRWDHLADPSLRAQERLFFELYAHALLGRPGTEGFLEEAVDGWITPVRALLIDAGIDEEDAEGLARLGLAVTRGLLLDLLATGDTAGTTRAFALFTQLLDLPSGHDISNE
ncbi:MAG: TetR family transcriptional regulator [Acidimicrobiales bacterium]|jgi:AcrR family transcriptional regulator|nr:TetR/AcrR family transcriptional regulator [Actinomycetota bacterium]MDA8358260.1 TetR/AcrR family transcriptional regulator [Actinomycetota bacterium]